MKKIDIHLHLAEKAEKRRSGRISYKSGRERHEDVMYLAGPEEMLPHMDMLGIGKAVILSGGEADNGKMLRICRKYPERFNWMCNLDEGEEGAVCGRLRQWKEKGAVGIGEFTVNRAIAHPFVETVFRAAEKLEMPLLFHMSPEEGFNYGVVDQPGLPLLEEALRSHPNLKLIGHSQPFWHEISGDASPETEARNSWGSGPVIPGGRLPELFDKYPNLYGDLSANSGGNALMRDEEFGLRFLEKYQDRLMFGTDMCNETMVFPLGQWLEKQYGAGRISRPVYEKVLYRNAEALFGILL